MSIVTVLPENKQAWLELRLQDITSTEVSALFGISPYLTEFELFYQKKEKTIVELAENERMKWGTLLQDSIAQGIAEEQGWKVRRMDEYIREDELRAGSSFDFCIEGLTQEEVNNSTAPDEATRRMLEGKGILEIKNVDSLIFLKTWEDGEPPLHIQIQVQHQLLVSGFSYAYIGVLVGGNSLHLIKQERNEKVIEGMKIRIAKFWKSIDDNTPPEPNFKVDAEFLVSLYGYAEPGKFKDVTEDAEIEKLALEYKAAGDQEKEAKKIKSEMKAKLLVLIEDAEKALGTGFTISAKTLGPVLVTAHERAGRRDFRINWKKEKK